MYDDATGHDFLHASRVAILEKMYVTTAIIKLVFLLLKPRVIYMM